MTRQPEHGASTMLPSLEAKLRQLAGELTPEDEAQLRAMGMMASADELSQSMQVKFRQCAAALTRDEATQLRLLSEFISGSTDDTAGFMIALYEGDPGNKGRSGQVGLPAGGDPASILGGAAINLATLISPLIGFISRPL